MNRSRWYDGQDFKINRDQVKGLPRQFRTRLRRELLLDRLTLIARNQSLTKTKSSLTSPSSRHHYHRRVTWSMNDLQNALNISVDNDTSSHQTSPASMMNRHDTRDLKMKTAFPYLVSSRISDKGGSIKSAKSRHKTLLQESQRFQQVLNHPEFRKNPLNAIHHHISSQSLSLATMKTSI
jgi:hypothetical protein